MKLIVNVCISALNPIHEEDYSQKILGSQANVSLGAAQRSPIEYVSRATPGGNVEVIRVCINCPKAPEIFPTCTLAVTMLLAVSITEIVSS
jgi:hypothetical protein